MARARGAVRGFWSDFRDFINRGNVVDLAVAVILGAAFTRVVDSIVTLVTSAILQPVLDAAGIDNIRNWPLGDFIVAVINFLLIALVIYLIVQALERFKRKQDVEVPAPDPVATQQRLADAIDRLTAALNSRQL
jgi:large conductance mechanosensitive channel